MPSRGPSAGLITASNAFALHLSRYSTVSEFRVELLLVATHVGTLHTSNTRVQPAYESLFLWANEQAELKNLKHTVPLKKLADILSLRDDIKEAALRIKRNEAAPIGAPLPALAVRAGAYTWAPQAAGVAVEAEVLLQRRAAALPPRAPQKLSHAPAARVTDDRAADCAAVPRKITAAAPAPLRTVAAGGGGGRPAIRECCTVGAFVDAATARRLPVPMRLCDIALSRSECEKLTNGTAAYGAYGEVIFGSITLRKGAVTRVVVKVSREDTTSRQNHRDEVDALRAVQGAPNVVVAYGEGEAADLSALGLPPDRRGRVFFIVFEALGRTLTQAVTGTPRGLLPIMEVVTTILDATKGVATCHARGIIHADLKGDNLMSTCASGSSGTRKTRTRVIDFGVACMSTAAGAATTRGNSGTPVYKAPELLADVDEPNSFKSDVYALGIVLSDMLCGTYRPWTGVRDFAARTIAGERPTVCSDIRADAPPELVDLMQKAWAQDPADRPTAAEMVVTLEVIHRALTQAGRLQRGATRS